MSKKNIKSHTVRRVGAVREPPLPSSAIKPRRATRTIISLTWRFVSLTAVLTTCLSGYAGPKEPQTCAGYPVASATDLEPAPKDKTPKQIDVNSDGLVDLIVAPSGVGGALYLNCGNELYYRAVRSAARLQAWPAKESGWAPLFIEWGEGDRSTLIDGQLYRPDLLPFSSKAPEDFLIEHDGASYTLPFGYCKALDLRAPLYRFDRKPEGAKNSIEQVSALHLELAQTKFRIEEETEAEYAFAGVYFTDLNRDGASDAVLYFGDTQGAGQETEGAFLLNCGDDSFVIGGRVRFGRIGRLPLIRSRTMAICGTPFTTLVVERLGLWDIMKPRRRPESNYELYLYRPASKIFVQIASAPDPRQSTFEQKIKGRCADILKRAYILRQ